MNHSDIDRSMDFIEDALRSYPLTPAPGPLQHRIMQRVRPFSAAPHFVFPWLEAALSLMLSTLLTSVAYLLTGISPATVLRLQQTARLFFVVPTYQSMVAATAAGLGMLLVCLILTLLLFRHPRGAHLAGNRTR
jgi:hypothetical protein